ncbi:conserved hypothetical protein [Vibrio nigripulchritudo SO65]|nr:conserved hypothetical protein [Vibrio nigripulchritudo AM115]CCN42150.1 conserved hypothetical protein [Vibrio nigripulchritudo FTn2]CCN62695.1 conserved hypothetical protein [Vibrio nigripulchritudo POn4]CCN75528.1 conserved hypothetical protein [Vibrio nigripulchritudo SO65]
MSNATTKPNHSTINTKPNDDTENAKRWESLLNVLLSALPFTRKADPF